MSRVDNRDVARLGQLGRMARQRREQLGESRRGLSRRLAERGQALAVTTIGSVEDGQAARGQTYAILERGLHWAEGAIMRYLTGGPPPEPVDPAQNPYWITHITAAAPGWWGITEGGGQPSQPHPIAVWAVIEIPAERPGGPRQQAIIGLTPGHAPGPAGAPLPDLDTATRCVYSPDGPPPSGYTLALKQFAAAVADRTRHVTEARVTACQVDQSVGGEAADQDADQAADRDTGSDSDGNGDD